MLAAGSDRRVTSRAIAPAFVTALAMLALVGIVISRAGGDPLALAQLGTQFSQGDPQGTEGYDGQFVYYLAEDLTLPRSGITSMCQLTGTSEFFCR